MFTVTVKVTNKLPFPCVITSLSFIYAVFYICFHCISSPVKLLGKKGGVGSETDNSCLPLLLKMWEHDYRRVIYHCGNWLNAKLIKQ